MAHILKKRRRGRPVVSNDEEDIRKAEGERIRKALIALKLSQASAAKLSGIPQGHLSEIISGSCSGAKSRARRWHRAVTVNDLRKLSRKEIGISADYVLGATEHFIPTGQSRPTDHLFNDLATPLAREVSRRVPPSYEGVSEPHQWMVHGERAFLLAAETLASRAQEVVREEERISKLKESVAAEQEGLNDLVRLIAETDHVPNSIVRLASRLAEKNITGNSAVIDQTKHLLSNPVIALIPQRLIDEFKRESRQSSGAESPPTSSASAPDGEPA